MQKMQMEGVMEKTRSIVTKSGRLLNETVSFIVFCVLDFIDFVLCFVFKAVDMLVEPEWRRPCYCSSAKEAITSSGKILVSEQGGESKIVSLSSTKLQLEDISDTLYSRPSLVSEVSRLTLNELKRLKLEDPLLQSKRGNSRCCSTLTVNTTIVEMLQGQIGRQEVHPIPRWSDCDCKQCTSWISPSKSTLFVNSQYPTSGNCFTLILMFIFFFDESKQQGLNHHHVNN